MSLLSFPFHPAAFFYVLFSFALPSPSLPTVLFLLFILLPLVHTCQPPTELPFELLLLSFAFPLVNSILSMTHFCPLFSCGSLYRPFHSLQVCLFSLCLFLPVFAGSLELAYSLIWGSLRFGQRVVGTPWTFVDN